MLIYICVIQTYFRVKTELKVIGHMSDPNSTLSDILSDGPVKDILRPAVDGNCQVEIYIYLLYLTRNRSEKCNFMSLAGIEPAALRFQCSALTN